ncbi:methyltransferase family protein [Ningiella sp. W23]|uniref:methyltransferase family protein n=1 Tax=Ningiella sp. W23 TaxID=3023715 RepID=UPI0037564528
MQNEFVGYFLAGFYTFVAIFYTLLVIKRNKKMGDSKCIHTGKRYSLHWFNHLTFRIFRITIWLVCVIHVFWSGIDPYLIPISTIDYPIVNLLGITMLIVGFQTAIASNMTLSYAWRSGIDEESKASLVTQGLYAFSRNPGFIGVGIAQVGFFLALPCVFSLVCMVIGLNALRIQAKLEESFLRQYYQQQYEKYANAVPRWVLFLGTNKKSRKGNA